MTVDIVTIGLVFIMIKIINSWIKIDNISAEKFFKKRVLSF